jgi:3-hydroxyisobutyrate dehydrogenase-like beta-hydroxyacid dehydrogenase
LSIGAPRVIEGVSEIGTFCFMARKLRKNVGVIGLGIIGSRAASGLRAAGFNVFVWNRTPRAAPNFLGSPAAVAEMCETIQIFVADGPALFEVIEAMGEKLTGAHLIICSATVGVEATREAAKMVQAKGASFLDAPFTGSKGAADQRQLVYYIGGEESVFLRAKPVLEANAKAIVPVGEIGHAAIVKVATNMIAAVSIQTLAEALALAQKAGVDPAMFAAALEQNACRSGTMELKLPKMLAGDFEPHFSLKHMFKDVQLGIHLANTLGVEIPATTVTAGVMYGALNHGWADLDFASLYRIYTNQAEADARRSPAERSAAQTGETSTSESLSPDPVDAEMLEMVETVPDNAHPVAVEEMTEAVTAGKASTSAAPEENATRPFNRIRRFFSPSGG